MNSSVIVLQKEFKIALLLLFLIFLSFVVPVRRGVCNFHSIIAAKIHVVEAEACC
jgi:hypothetical protein